MVAASTWRSRPCAWECCRGRGRRAARRGLRWRSRPAGLSSAATSGPARCARGTWAACCGWRGRATPHRTPTTGRRRSSRWQRSCCGLGSSTSARSWARANLARAPFTSSTGEVRRRSRQLSRGQGRRGRQRPEAAMASAAAVVSGTAGDRAGRQSASSRPSWLQRRRDRQRLEAAMAIAAAAPPGAARC
jgi:hypothetical protein